MSGTEMSGTEMSGAEMSSAEPVRVFDAHRIAGPLPGEPAADPAGLLADLDHLGIDACAVTTSAELLGDPAGAPARDAARTWSARARFLPVPVIVPAVAGAGWPAGVDELLATPPAMVRICPRRHRFDPHGPVASAWWAALAGHGVPVALDVTECGLDTAAALARAWPELGLLLLTPGYRELRRLAELLDTAPGVRVETGTLVAAGAVEWLARRFGAHRLVFGSGAPRWDDAGARFLLDHLELPESDVALIAAGSAAALIGQRWPW